MRTAQEMMLAAKAFGNVQPRHEGTFQAIAKALDADEHVLFCCLGGYCSSDSSALLLYNACIAVSDRRLIIGGAAGVMNPQKLVRSFDAPSVGTVCLRGSSSFTDLVIEVDGHSILVNMTRAFAESVLPQLASALVHAKGFSQKKE